VLDNCLFTDLPPVQLSVITSLLQPVFFDRGEVRRCNVM
jgi:hypothetical protein